MCAVLALLDETPCGIDLGGEIEWVIDLKRMNGVCVAYQSTHQPCKEKNYVWVGMRSLDTVRRHGGALAEEGSWWARWIETSGESAADHNASSSPNRQQEDRCTHARTDRLFSRHTSHELVR